MFIIHCPGSSQLQIGRSTLGKWVSKPALQLDYLQIGLFANRLCAYEMQSNPYNPSATYSDSSILIQNPLKCMLLPMPLKYLNVFTKNLTFFT